MNKNLLYRLMAKMPKKWLLFFIKKIYPIIMRLEHGDSLLVMSDYNKLLLDSTYKAFCHPERTVFTTMFLPSEIIHALDLIPFALELNSTMLGKINETSRALEKSESLCESTDLCTFHRASLGYVARGIFPNPLCILSYDYVCNNNTQTPKKCAEIINKPMLHLGVPLENNDDAVSFLKNGLNNMARDLEKLTFRAMNQKKLRQTILNANKTRGFILQINELRKNEFAPPIETEDALNFFVVRSIFTGSAEAQDFFQKLYEELRQKTRNRQKLGLSRRDKIKILWLEFKPCYATKIFDLIRENKNVEVVFEELNYIDWPELDEFKPYESLAKKIISCHYHQTGEKRLKVLEKLINDYEIDAAISFSNWGCRRNNVLVPAIEKKLKKLGVAFLNIEGDGLDPTAYMSGQIRTRIEAFMEQITQNKK